MKTQRSNRFLSLLNRFLAVQGIAFSITCIASAATNTWTGATNQTWDTTTSNWADPSVWNNGDEATFSPGAGAVQVDANLTISGLTMTGAGDSIVIGAGRTLQLDYPLAIAATTGGWGSKIAGSGTLRLGSAQPINGSANWGPNAAAAIPFLPAFTGSLILDNGRIDSSAAGLGGISAITIEDGAQFLAWSGTYSQPFTLSGDGWGEAGQPGALRVAAGNNSSYNSDITLNGDASFNSQDGNSVFNLNGSVVGTGSLTLHTRGKFNFNGSASESYSGGTLRIVTTGAGPAASTITFNKPPGSVAVPANTAIQFGTPGGTGQANLRMALFADNQFGTGVAMHFPNPSGQWSRFDLIGTTQTLTGITTGNFTTQGAGVVQNREINGVANYGPATLILNGNTTDPGYPAGGYVFNGHFRDADSGVNASNLLNLVKEGNGTQILIGGVIGYSGTTTVNAGTLTFSRTNGVNTSIENNATVEIHSAGGDDWILNNNRTLSGAGVWNKTGAGRASFNNATILTTGQFNILDGTLRNNNNVSNWSASTASVAISAGATLDLFADAIHVAMLTGAGTVQNGFGNAGGQSGAAPNFEKLVVGVADSSSTFAGTIRNNGGNNLPNGGTTNGGGGLELHKEGTGTLTLTGSLTYTGITNLVDGTLEIGGSLNNTLAGSLQGSASLIKSGTGRLTLAAANPFSGTTTIQGGTLAIGGSAANTAITVQNGGTLRSNATGKTFSNVALQNGAALELPAVTGQTTNVGSLTLASSPNVIFKPFFAAEPLVGTYDLLTPGGVTGSPGTITTDFGIYNAARGVSGSTELTGGKLVLTVSGTFTGAANLVWTNRAGAGTGVWKAKSPADNNFDNGGSSDQFFDLDNVAFNGAASGAITLSGPLLPGSITVNSSTGDYTFGGTGTITGPTTLVKSGSSALTVATTNSFSGAVTINAGTINANAPSALGSGPITLASGTLNVGAPGALAATQGINFPTGSAATIRLNGNSTSVSSLNNQFPFIGVPVIESGSTVIGTDVLTVGGSASGTFTGILQDGSTRSLGLTKAGSGALTLIGSSSNTYSGPTILTGTGQLILGKTDGAVAIPGDLILAASGVRAIVSATQDNQFGPNSVIRFSGSQDTRFELKGTTQTIGGVDNSAGLGVYQTIQHSEFGVPPAIDANSDLILNVVDGASHAFNSATGSIRDFTGGTLSVTKNGLGTQTFSGPNIIYTGGTIINAGKLVFASANVGRGALTINNGASLELAAANATDQLASITIEAGGTLLDQAAAHNVQVVNLNGGTMAATSAPLPSYGHFVLNNTVNVGGSQTSVISADVRVSGNRDGIFNVNPTGDPSGIDLDITGRIGHLNFVAWSFMTKTGDGTLRLNNPTQVNDIGRLTVSAGRVIFNDQFPTLGNGGLINNATVEVITAEDTQMVYGGAFSGTTGNLIKTGPGSLALTNAAATYSGALTVNQGLLSIPTRASTLGVIQVAGGATFRIASLTGTVRASGFNLANGSTIQINNFTGDELLAPLESVTNDPVFNGNVSVEVAGIEKTGTFPLIFYPLGGTVGGTGVAALNLLTNRSINAVLVDNAADASIDLQVNAVNPVTWVGNNGPAWNADDTNKNWTLSGTATAYQDKDLVRFDDSADLFSVVLDDVITPSAVNFANETAAYHLSGTGSISGAGKVTKSGAGNAIIASAHTHSGGTFINEGSLQLGDGTTNGSLTGTIANEAELILNNGPAQTLAATITGAGTVRKTGAGVFSIATAQPYAGPTIVDGGTLRLAAPGSIASETTVNTGAILNLSGIINIGHPAGFRINVNDGGAVNYSNQNPVGAAWSVLNGPYTNSGNSAINITAVSSPNNSGLYLDGGLHGTGTITINATVAGNGVNFRNDNSTYTGALIVNGIASPVAGVGSGIGVGGCTIALGNTDITVNGTMELLNRGIGWANTASGQFRVGALNGTGVIVGNFTGGGVTTITMGATNANGSFDGRIFNGDGNIVQIVKIGDGSQALSGDNTYTGFTSITEGTLMVNNTSGSATGTGAVTVSADATLGGTGAISGTLAIAAGGFISPGTSGTESLATGSATLAGTYLCELDGANSDRVDVTGNLDATGGTIAFSTINPPTAAQFVIATYTGALLGELPTIQGMPAGYDLDLNTPGQILLVKQGATGFDNWATLNGLDGSNNGPDFDADGDGISNQLEFYLDGNPLVADSSILPQPAVVGDDFVLTFMRRDDAEAEATSQTLRFSAGLDVWTSVPITATDSTQLPSGVIIEVAENGAEPDDITVRIPRSHAVGGKLFAQIQVTR